MDSRILAVACLSLGQCLFGQNETSSATNSSTVSLSCPPSPLPSSLLPSAPPPGGSGDGQPFLLTVVYVSVLSVLCVMVLAIVVLVLAVRIRRGVRRWRGDREISHRGQKRRALGNGATAHLLSAALSSTHNFEWYRPRSLSPSSPLSSSPPHSPLLHPLTNLPPSPSASHDYTEVPPLPPSGAEARPHLYEEIDEDHMTGAAEEETFADEVVQRTQVHLYSLLEDPTHCPDGSTPPSPATVKQQSLTSSEQWKTDNPEQILDNEGSTRDASISSLDSSISIQDSNLNWVFSPVCCREQPDRKPPRRVIPYRVSLILPHWEAGERGPALPHPRALAGQAPVNSTSCLGLEDYGRYNHLDGIVAGYGSLDDGVYATLEPFLKAEPMRPRSRSCDARLYNHLQH